MPFTPNEKLDFYNYSQIIRKKLIYLSPRYSKPDKDAIHSFFIRTSRLDLSKKEQFKNMLSLRSKIFKNFSAALLMRLQYFR